jgi:hypothetical protein
MNLRKTAGIRSVSRWLSLGLLSAGLSAMAVAQSEPVPPPPPMGPGMMMTMQGPDGGGAFFHHEVIGESPKVVTGAPMTAVIETTRDTTLSDGNTIHTQNQSTVYRDSQGRVRREVPFELATPTTGVSKGTMIIIMDPVSGNRYVLNPQNKTVHQMPLRPPKAMPVDTIGGGPAPVTGQVAGQAVAGAGGPVWKGKGTGDVNTEQLGTKTILGLQATGTRMTHTIPAGEIGNARPISVVTERWVSNDLQIPLSMTHNDPMMGNMSSTVTSITRGEPDASLFQVPSDYKVETGKHGGDMMYMQVKP